MLSVKHLIDTTSLTADDITQILDTARSFSEVNKRAIKKVPALRGRTIVNLFLEPSTRTKSSFELAEKRLSADSLSMGGATSSVVKGESLADTIETIDAMNVDMFICRAKLAGTPQKITEHTDAIVINARRHRHQRRRRQAPAPHAGHARPLHHPRELRPPRRPQGRHRGRPLPQPRVRLARSRAQDHGRRRHARGPAHLPG